MEPSSGPKSAEQLLNMDRNDQQTGAEARAVAGAVHQVDDGGPSFNT